MKRPDRSTLLTVASGVFLGLSMDGPWDWLLIGLGLLMLYLRERYVMGQIRRKAEWMRHVLRERNG
jgi:hypothetical protein